MDGEFIEVLKQLVAEQGSAALTDAKKCRPLLADYAKNEFKKESRLLLQAVEAGVAKVIEGAGELEPCKKAQIRDLEEDQGLSSDFAADIVNALALVLRGDTTVTVSPNAEKIAAERDAAEKAAAAQTEAERAAAEKAAAESQSKIEAAEKAAAESKAKAEAERAAAERASAERAVSERAAAERAATQAANERAAAERAAQKAAADRAAAERAAAAQAARNSSRSYSRPSGSGVTIFAIVGRYSGRGSTFIFGVIVAAIGAYLGSLIGGWIALGVGAVLGWVVGSQVIGRSVYVNLLAIILGVASGVLIAFLAGWVGNGLRPDLAPAIARTLFIPFAIAGTVLFLIARSKGITALLVVLIVFSIGGGIALTEPPFPSSFSRGITTVAQTINASIATTTATVTSGSANFRSAPSTSGNIIKTLQKGEVLTVTGDAENGWIPVRHGIDSGYVSADLISIDGATGTQAASAPSPAPVVPAQQEQTTTQE